MCWSMDPVLVKYTNHPCFVLFLSFANFRFNLFMLYRDANSFHTRHWTQSFRQHTWQRGQFRIKLLCVGIIILRALISHTVQHCSVFSASLPVLTPVQYWCQFYIQIVTDFYWLIAAHFKLNEKSKQTHYSLFNSFFIHDFFYCNALIRS